MDALLIHFEPQHRAQVESEKIIARMKLLQELVPGYRIPENAGIVNETIDHIQSLELQVEFPQVRCENISEEILFFQGLVPGCDNNTEYAENLDEIIDYVQSLQRQAEFLSMKLEAANSRLDFNKNNFSAKEVKNINNALVMSFNLTAPLPPGEATAFYGINGPHNRHQGEVAGQGQEITQIRERNANFGPNLKKDEIVNPPQENSNGNGRRKLISNGNRRRKLTSKVWDDFTREYKDGKIWAICKYCKKKFDGSSEKGTTHLKNHLDRCSIKRDLGRGADKSPKTGDCNLTSSVAIKEKSNVDQEFNHLDEARKIIKYWGSSLESMKDGVLGVYQEEKSKLRTYFNELPCRINVTIEYGYGGVYFMVLRFIDDSWELRKRIIYFKYAENNSDFLKILKCSLPDWNIEKNICSIVDNSTSTRSEEFIEIYGWLRKRGSLPFTGYNFPVSCLVDQLELRMYDWSENMFHKIKELLAYVRTMSSNKNNFQIEVDEGDSMVRKLIPQGTTTTWLRDFELLKWAIRFREAFCELDPIDPYFKSINLTEEEWGNATALFECFKELKDAARSFSPSKYTTINAYFPKVCDIFIKLLRWKKSGNHYIGEMASFAREKFFDEYWRNSNMVLVIAIILDPRFKMDIIERWYMEIYGSAADTHLKKVVDDVTNIYNEYAKSSRSSKLSTSLTPFTMLDSMGRPCTLPEHVNNIASQESDLDRYLKDSKFPTVEEFDILAWWRVNSPTFPTLAKMANDFLAIPTCADGDVLDSSLKTQIRDIIWNDELENDIREALVLTKIWWYNSPETA